MEVFSEETGQVVRVLSRDVIEVECMADAMHYRAYNGRNGHVLVEGDVCVEWDEAKNRMEV